MTTPNPSPRRSERKFARKPFALACLAVAALLRVTTAQAMSEPAAQPQGPGCPMLMLLMDFECNQYQQRRERAGNNEERDRIDREYWQLGEERRKSCRCNASRSFQDAGDRPRVDVCQ